MTAALTVTSLIKCSQALVPVPVPLIGPPTAASVNGLAVATINMMIPFVNIPMFGICASEGNPGVPPAKIIGLPGVPCTPMVAAPWSPASAHVTVCGLPAAMINSKCMCSFGGEISVDVTDQEELDV